MDAVTERIASSGSTPRTGRPIGKPIQLPVRPFAVAFAKDAVWVAHSPATRRPTIWSSSTRGPGESSRSVKYPAGISSLAATPAAIWAAARRRARIQRIDLKTGQPRRSTRVGSNNTEDLVYHDGALWAATPEDNAVYKINLKTLDKISVSVGGFRASSRSATARVYVTNYSSSQLYIHRRGVRGSRSASP